MTKLQWVLGGPFFKGGRRLVAIDAVELGEELVETGAAEGRVQPRRGTLSINAAGLEHLTTFEEILGQAMYLKNTGGAVYQIRLLERIGEPNVEMVPPGTILALGAGDKTHVAWETDRMLTATYRWEWAGWAPAFEWRHCAARRLLADAVGLIGVRKQSPDALRGIHDRFRLATRAGNQWAPGMELERKLDVMRQLFKDLIEGTEEESVTAFVAAQAAYQAEHDRVTRETSFSCSRWRPIATES